jgi:adenylate cyclase
VPLEIERKFLVANSDWRGSVEGERRLVQGYLAGTDKAVVRVRIEDDSSAVLTIKSATPGLARQEFEYELPLEDAHDLLALRQGALLTKTRYDVPHAGRIWEVDVYGGENAGLVLAEAELEREDERLELPPWLDREVTEDERYYASSLALRPFRSWAAAAAR